MSEIITIFNIVMWAIGMITTFAAALCIVFYIYQHHLERKHKSAQEECCAQEGMCIVCGAESGVFIKCAEHRKGGIGMTSKNRKAVQK